MKIVLITLAAWCVFSVIMLFAFLRVTVRGTALPHKQMKDGSTPSPATNSLPPLQQVCGGGGCGDESGSEDKLSAHLRLALLRPSCPKCERPLDYYDFEAGYCLGCSYDISA